MLLLLGAALEVVGHLLGDVLVDIVGELLLLPTGRGVLWLLSAGRVRTRASVRRRPTLDLPPESAGIFAPAWLAVVVGGAVWFALGVLAICWLRR